MRHMQNNVILVIAVIVSLAIGGGGAYAINYFQVTTLTNEKAGLQTQIAVLSSEKTQLQTQVASLTNEKTALQTQTATLTAEKTILQSQVNTINSEYTSLANRYDLLADSIDAIHSSNWTRTATYNITAGTLKTQYFSLDKYGIIWETVIDFSGTSVNVVYYYWYNGLRNFVTNSRQSLITENDPNMPYYGPQNYLYGTINLSISIDYRIENRIWINYLTITQFPQVRMSGNISIDVSS
jgi:cell division protein FtsB